jgi:hypothetical protein
LGGKAGAAAAKVINAVSEEIGAGDGKGAGPAPELTTSTSTAMADDGKGSGGSGGETTVSKDNKTNELLHEATQLLKTLRVNPANPRLKVMQISDLEQVEDNMVLIDSGATHGFVLLMTMMNGAKQSARWFNWPMDQRKLSV